MFLLTTKPVLCFLLYNTKFAILLSTSAIHFLKQCSQQFEQGKESLNHRKHDLSKKKTREFDSHLCDKNKHKHCKFAHMK